MSKLKWTKTLANYANRVNLQDEDVEYLTGLIELVEKEAEACGYEAGAAWQKAQDISTYGMLPEDALMAATKLQKENKEQRLENLRLLKAIDAIMNTIKNTLVGK